MREVDPNMTIYSFNVLPGAAKWCSEFNDGIYVLNPRMATHICPAEVSLSKSLTVALRSN